MEVLQHNADLPAHHGRRQIHEVDAVEKDGPLGKS
jgi:hypothetical protein